MDGLGYSRYGAVLLALATLTIPVQPAVAQSRQPVQFAAGQSAATIKGSLRGDVYIDYIVRAKAGQTLDVSMKAGNASAYFNVSAPDAGAVAMFIGSVSGEKFKRLLPADGEYTIRAYLMRNAARRNESSAYALHVGVTGKALAPLPSRVDAKIAKTPFHASTQVPCTPWGGAAGQCDAFVIRRGNDGTGTVEVRLPDGETRRVLFVKGAPTTSDSTQQMSSKREGDLTTVTFEAGETFVIPDMLVSGG
ncbi:MAG: hypothetical protein K2Y29_13710 [Beijerinckiaceae bacterium]|nr:hypothetical protein [Beijerinckiaceae bacterium]